MQNGCIRHLIRSSLRSRLVPLTALYRSSYLPVTSVTTGYSILLLHEASGSKSTDLTNEQADAALIEGNAYFTVHTEARRATARIAVAQLNSR